MKVFIIAGEKSGDLIGAEIIKELIIQNHSVYGIGGSEMLEAGLSSSIFDIKEISVMGFVEVVPKAFKISELINKTVFEIASLKPDVLLTIDSPGFNTRVVSKLKKSGFKGKMMHVVAPTVWAYKPKRAIKFSLLFNKLFCILPFEPPYFVKYGLDAKYVGYPPLERLKNFTKLESEKKYIMLALGSRRGEVLKHLEFAREIIDSVKKELPEVVFVLPTFEEFKQEISSVLPDVTLAITEEEKSFFMQRAVFGIYKSGTGAVEASICGIPIVIFYKANFFSYIIIKMMAKTKYANIINILLGREAIPEFLQFNCTPRLISSKVIKMLKQKEELEIQLKSVKKAIDILRTEEESFAKIISKEILG